MNNPLNGNIFGLMIEPRDGLYAGVDQGSGMFVSYRKDNKSAFPAPVQITVASGGTAFPGTYTDPALGYVDNKLKLFYVDKIASIIMRDITMTISNNVLTKAEVQGSATVVASLTTRPHSPTPMIDKLGEVRGLLMAANFGADSDMYFQSSLNNLDTPIQLFDNTAWMNNGGVAGGRIFFANNATPTSANVADVCWLLGSNTALGGTATITMGCRNGKSVAPVVAILALSLKINAGTRSPLVITGWNGAFPLAAPEIVFTNVVAINKDELAHFSQVVPNTPGLKGKRISIQALALPKGGVPPTFTNTATLEFK
jgi:hypothetical protein